MSEEKMKPTIIEVPCYKLGENEELKRQVSALTQALETQNRENQPYIKELEKRVNKAKSESRFMIWSIAVLLIGLCALFMIFKMSAA
jgi:hypothetical protein